jgi:hypothetical protein
MQLLIVIQFSMDSLKKNKELIISYYNAISGVRKPVELCQKFTSDQRLLDNIQFWDGVFPAYELFADEIIAEGNRVVVRARMKGKHEGTLNGIPPTLKEIELPFVIGYEVKGNMIVGYWLVADQVLLLSN